MGTHYTCTESYNGIGFMNDGLFSDGEYKVIKIDEAVKGTDYICGECGGVLRVRSEYTNSHGTKVDKCFFHDVKRGAGTGESIFHKYWKNRLANMRAIKLPYASIIEVKKERYGRYYEEYNIPHTLYKFSLDNYMKVDVLGARLEQRTLNGRYIPDIIVTVGNSSKQIDVIVEVCYKNAKKVDEYERSWESLKMPVYEVTVDETSILSIQLLYSEKLKEVEAEVERLKDEEELRIEKVIEEREEKRKQMSSITRKVESVIYEKYNYKFQKYNRKFGIDKNIEKGVNNYTLDQWEADFEKYLKHVDNNVRQYLINSTNKIRRESDSEFGRRVNRKTGEVFYVDW